MAPKYKEEPIRMCIVCRTRAAQSTLIRLQCQDSVLKVFTGVGRSFYVCQNCIDSKSAPRALARQCKTKATQTVLQQFKEFIVDDR